MIVDDREKHTLQTNIINAVHPGIEVHSDGWKSYSILENQGFSHSVVNHKETFVAVSNGTKVTTNTLEGVHGVIKRKARKMNLFSGQGAGSGLE